MGSPVFHEFKRQASFFFKEKIKTARLALTDVTPVELLTEEATNVNMISPNSRSMAAISRAAFEVDDYWRIVDILHKRLENFDAKNWRASYNALVLLEHLLTHGPYRIAEEFRNDKDSIEEMENFQHIDEKRFNWGLCVRKLSNKILMLLESESFLKEERARARKLTMGIKGFGSNNGRSNSKKNEWIKITEEEKYNEKNKLGLSLGKLETNGYEYYCLESSEDGDKMEKEHPFCESEYDEQETAESLLSSTM